MQPSDEKINLLNIGSGAAAELFAIHLEKVLKNIMDINTVDGNREITLKFTLAPNDRRDEIGIHITCASKLGATTGFKTAAAIGLGSDGKAVANEYIQRQIPLDMNVHPIRKQED